MAGISAAPRSLFLLLALPLLSSAQWEHGNSDALFSFLSRPDLKPPKWNVTVYQPDKVAPGYWFVGPYAALRNREDETDSWIGPHIYDGNGEPVWSGTEMFDNGKDTMSFQIHNVRGEELMTLLDWSTGEGVLFDNHYEIRETVDIYADVRTNAHEFHFVDNGSKAIVIKTKYEVSTEEDARAVGLKEGLCHAHFDGIQEFDTNTWETSWEWNSRGHIGLNESTYAQVPLEERCTPSHLGWDFIHCNSIDKSSGGDYLLSCRHSNTIYKISHKDGSILWRFGGSMSDFDQGDLVFGRQHNIRIRGENGTHTIVSFLDNAKGQDDAPPSHPYSRGLLVALDEKNMKSAVLKEIAQPDLEYAPKRGSYQALANGNVFMGWSTKALQSEHAPDGSMVMQARMLASWLGSYRNYKFPFVGKPLSKPDIHSAAYGIQGRDEARTVVHVSWNGATEVETWRFWKSIPDGEYRELLGTRVKSGFETNIEVEGYASYVFVEALDGDGEVLGHSGPWKTQTHPNMTAVSVEKENAWLLEAADGMDKDDGKDVDEADEGEHHDDVHEHNHDDEHGGHVDVDVEEAQADTTTQPSETPTPVSGGTDVDDDNNNSLLTSILQSQLLAFVVGFASCATIALVVWLTWRKGTISRLTGRRYAGIGNGSSESFEGESILEGRFADEDDEDSTMVEDAESKKLLGGRDIEKGVEPPDKYEV